jgi:hypothetical protein
VFSEHCERLMLVDTIERALWLTRHLEGMTNLGPEDLALKQWRIGAKEALRIESEQRPKLPADLFAYVEERRLEVRT